MGPLTTLLFRVSIIGTSQKSAAVSVARLNAGERCPRMHVQNLYIHPCSEQLCSEITQVSCHASDGRQRRECSSSPSEGTATPPLEADSGLFCISPALVCQLSYYRHRVCSAERLGIQTYCYSAGFTRIWDVSCLTSDGREEGMRGWVGGVLE